MGMGMYSKGGSNKKKNNSTTSLTEKILNIGAAAVKGGKTHKKSKLTGPGGRTSDPVRLPK